MPLSSNISINSSAGFLHLMCLKYCFTATLTMLCKVLGLTFLFQVSKFHAYIWPSILIGIPFLPIWASFSFSRSQTISCSSLLNFSRKTCRGLWDNFGFFFLSYSTNFIWASITTFIVPFMLGFWTTPSSLWEYVFLYSSLSWNRISIWLIYMVCSLPLRS